MKTQLGMYKTMAEGGLAPDIVVGDDVIKKIRASLVLKNFNNTFNFQKLGQEDNEYDYKICFNDNHKDKLFVISQVKTFDNNKLVSHRFNLYCYDVSGNKIDFNQYTDCTNGFYENCYILKDDLI